MNLSFDAQPTAKYHSQSQITRIVTETWFENNMFCPRCGNLQLKSFENNRPVADFYCPRCKNEYELKSKHTKFGKKICGSEYKTMLRRITENNNPDLFCLQYDRENRCVINLIFIPKYFFVPAIIEKRSPLKETARRAGWVGCNILISKIPEQARIRIVTDGKVENINDIVQQVQKCNLISTKDLKARGWLLDVLNCTNSIKTPEFTLNEVYQFEEMLSASHPQNNNIRAKIRQQLQLLRDKGFITFLGNGRYRRN